MAVTLTPHKELIRKLAQEGKSDADIASRLGSKAASIGAFRCKNDIFSGLHYRTIDRIARGIFPRSQQYPDKTHKSGLQADLAFTKAIGSKTFSDRQVIAVGRMSGHLAHTLGGAASSAWTCAEAGEKSGGWF